MDKKMLELYSDFFITSISLQQRLSGLYLQYVSNMHCWMSYYTPHLTTLNRMIFIGDSFSGKDEFF